MIYERIADKEGYIFFNKYDSCRAHVHEPIPHFHNSVEMYVCTNGECSVHINGETRRLYEGDVAFVDRLTPHSADAFNGEVYVVLASSSYLSAVDWLERETLPAFTPGCRGFDKIKELTVWAYGLKSEMNTEMRRGFITLLLGLMRKYCGSVTRGADKNTKVLVEIMRYIDEYYSEQITLESLSKKYGYERTYLSRIFNKLLGMNLREYLNRRRIDAVNRMKQENKGVPIYKIYAACGFDSPNTYYRAVKKYCM